jgi:hypothetical protein
MEKRLTQLQLEKIVAEVEQLSQRQQAELDATQVKDILRELNLPPELFEEAIVQLHRREALALQTKRNRLIAGSIIASIAVVLFGVTIFAHYRHQTLDRVTAQRDRLTLAQDNGSNLNAVARQANGQVLFYRVTLSDAPVGQKLELSCSWRDPSGQIVHQNRYQTKQITTPVWNTFCRHTLGGESLVGRWQVEAFLGDRLLSETAFDVK